MTSHSLVPADLAIDLRQLVMTIAHTVDLVGVDDVFHGRRVGMLAREMAIQMGWPEADQLILYDAGLLHDCGVSSTRVHHRLVVDLEWAGAEEHCVCGDALLAGFAPLAHLAPIIRYHHSRWDWLSAQNLPGNTARFANLIYLADRIDVLAAPHHADQTILSHVDEIRNRLASQRGGMFSPELIDAFEAMSQGEAFWLALQPDWVQQYQTDMECYGDLRLIGWADFKQCAEIFARIIDAKSPYTQQHSRGVSRLARYLAEHLGLDAITCEKIEVAGLLHDIGKLQIPDEIIEGQSGLTAHEFDIMKSHSYGTLQVLKRLHAVEEIARWAAYHHETPDGHGYPFRISGDALPLEARIINVADIFQALAQERPYRQPMQPDQIMTILNERAALGRADAEIVSVVADNLDQCHRVALCRE
ncbi:MAG: HD domain-containing protein [Rhodocyclales bacterium GT-UBC]|nr:MAG: HD domain-containing protein [Rhodocyclales bacterium GT-UBC]